MATQARLTADDVLRLADQGKNYELVNGELVEISPTGGRHGQLELTIARVLDDFVKVGALFPKPRKKIKDSPTHKS